MPDPPSPVQQKGQALPNLPLPIAPALLNQGESTGSIATRPATVNRREDWRFLMQISWPTGIGAVLALVALVIILVLMITGKLTGMLAIVLLLLALARLL